ncbi:MAG: hypothetical protein WD941_05285 [Opitutus sp.]
MKKFAKSQQFGIMAAVAASAFLGTGCGTRHEPRDLMMEEARSGGNVERPVAMRGDTTFLEGKVAAVATVSRGFDSGREGMGRSGRTRYDDDGRYGRRANDGFSQVYNIYDASEEQQKEAIQEYIRQAMARRAAGSPMPPVTLRVEFENRSAGPLEIEVTEVNSYLGNFAVRPPKLSLEPGAKGVLEPMVSQLGVTSDEIPLKLEVRYAGLKEAQTVLVKNVLAESLRQQAESAQK